MDTGSCFFNGWLTDGDWKLMNLLWDESPLTIGGMVDALRDDTAWTKATVNIMLSRLADKGAVRIDATGRRKLFYPLLARECELSDAEIDELYRVLKEGRRDRD